ncbi:uncharacterized protein CXorf66 homolog [Sciurus carolinensis]|uniref:uncharacterized protein CXorf66 homolog n=1 Tax=Sciurus carolinensis TaxID=30640 RepID=UPI001FB3B5C4|nr:uncharacterized protein CXorf66 homolog [Sciurus carolinensis]
MNFLIYVLFLSIWTINCLNTSQSDGSSNTGAKQLESMETKMDNFRKHLLIIIIGVMVVAFVFTCFCFLHYNCMNEDAHKAGIKVIHTVQCRKVNQAFECKKAQTTQSSHLEKSCKTYSLEKSYKLAHAHKIVSQVHASYPDKPVRLPWPVSLQSSARPAKSRFLPHPHNHILLSKSSSLRKLVKSPRRRHLKRSISIGKAVMLSKPVLAKNCQYYKEKCLVCKTTSETLVHISEAKKENSGNLFSSSNMKTFPRSFQKVDSKDDVYYDNVSDSDMMTYDSDDSETEIIIICNIRSNNIIPYGTSKK